MLDNTKKTLPEPDETAKQQSNLLLQAMAQASATCGGQLNFSEYMNMALYQPNLGYYSNALQKFGAQGDFITAPEVSPLFGQCLAQQIKEINQNFAEQDKKKSVLIEFGAGSGALAVSVLQELEKENSLPSQYLIIELSAQLQQRQKTLIQEKIPALQYLVKWLNQLPDNIENAVIVANEVLDAMPVQCFKVEQGKVQSLMVSIKNNKLSSCYQTADKTLADKIDEISQRSEISFADGYCSQVNLYIKAWLAALTEKITNFVILIIDYGYNEKEYYSEERTQGSLMCYYRHHAHNDFFWWPGLQDITAFVNFTDVAYSAVALDLEVLGFTTQAAFLLANGLDKRHAAQVDGEIINQIKLAQQIKTLTLPSEMGERFKVIALAKNYDKDLSGFSLLDLRNRL